MKGRTKFKRRFDRRQRVCSSQTNPRICLQQESEVRREWIRQPSTPIQSERNKNEKCQQIVGDLSSKNKQKNKQIFEYVNK